MKIVFFETEEWERAFFERKLAKHELHFYSEKLSVDNASLIKDAEVVSIFINSRIDATVLKQAVKLLAVVTRSTGTDHIDTAFCTEKNIKVLNVPHYGVGTVAEHTFALILALSRRIIPSVLKTKECCFDNEGLMGFELSQKTLGIIGYGNIGQRVAEIAQAFKMKVLVHNRTEKEEKGVVFVDLETLLSESDIITLHLPLTPETKHTLNKKNVSKIKKGALLINTSRGPLVDTAALLQALENKTLAGAGLDVLEEEGAIKEERQLLSKGFLDPQAAKTMLMGHILLDFPNVIITPHNAFNSKEAIDEINQKTVDNILTLTQKELMDRISRVKQA